ncbi:MAG: glycogen synthase GlgA [Verrucomicrobiota bacterium]|nr:glycogen synthase GlgA [Verrucomicrobiota bacterium]
MKILFVSPEVSPFARTGGLGDVVGSLPIELKHLGIDVRIMCPMYESCKKLPTNRHSGKINIGDLKKSHKASILESQIGETNVPLYLVENDFLFARDGIYSDAAGDFQDNIQRAFALCRAALKLNEIVDWEPEVFHTHDWMAAPLSPLLNASPRIKKKPRKRSVLTIHNLEHQGKGTFDEFKQSGLPNDYWGSSFDYFGSMNLLKGGIQHADKITTVSPTYAEEIKSEAYGCGLENILNYRAADLIGILNGMDEKLWDPQNDSLLPTPIDPTKPSTGKKKCKLALQKEMNLPLDSEVPVFGVVSRLCRQKGLDLLIKALPELMFKTTAQFIVLGSGDSEEESAFRLLSQKFEDRIASHIGFDDGLARRIFGGSDFFLMPSRFEPCGLAQQYSMRYGSIPIARKTGGLADTIHSFISHEKSSNGFLFEEDDHEDFKSVIYLALRVFNDRKTLNMIQTNAFQSSCSWQKAAKEYAKVYQWAKGKN